VPKVSKQHIRINKMIGLLIVLDVAVIAFAGFIVVAQHANAIDDQRKTVLERMNRSTCRSRQSPYDDFDKCPRVQDMSFVKQQFRLMLD
jgi:hypothetical protein